jgi:hypothetical protein
MGAGKKGIVDYEQESPKGKFGRGMVFMRDDLSPEQVPSLSS